MLEACLHEHNSREASLDTKDAAAVGAYNAEAADLERRQSGLRQEQRDLLLGTGVPVLVLAMPEPSEKIVGIAVAGDTVYFSTPKKVYTLAGGMAVPRVIGLGGRLRLAPDGLYVLDSAQGRVYRIVVSKTPEAKK